VIFNIHQIKTQRYHSLSTMSHPVLEAVGYGKLVLLVICGPFCKINFNHYLVSSITWTSFPFSLHTYSITENKDIYLLKHIFLNIF